METYLNIAEWEPRRFGAEAAAKANSKNGSGISVGFGSRAHRPDLCPIHAIIAPMRPARMWRGCRR